MTFKGMDTDAARKLAQRVDRLLGQLSDLRASVDRDVASVKHVWRGPGAERFMREWDTTHRPHILQARTVLQELRDALNRNAGAQDETSAQRTVDSVTGGPDGQVHRQRHEPYTRNEAGTSEQRARIDVDLKALRGNGSAKHYPAAYAQAEAWASELRANPNASAAELVAYDKYCFLLHTANINRSSVHDFAQISVDNYHEAAKAQIEGVVGAAGLGKIGDPIGHTVRQGAMSGVTDYGKSFLRGVGVEAVAGGDVDGVVAVYDKQADAYLASIYDKAHSADNVSVVTGAQTMSMHTSEFDGRLATMRIEAETVGAFDFATGSDSVADSGLRGVLKTVPGVSQGLTLSEVGGNWFKAGTAESVAIEAYRQAAVGGMDSLIRASESSGFAD